MTQVLVTGFGPFPGVPRNVSGELARRFGGIVLPTEWCSEVALPAGCIVLHLGVSRRAGDLVLEQCAYADRRRRTDAAGAMPAAARQPGPSLLTTPFDARRLAAALRRAGHPAVASRQPGRYLCNAVYYASLRAGVPALFVHIPARRVALPRLAASLRYLIALLENTR